MRFEIGDLVEFTDHAIYGKSVKVLGVIIERVYRPRDFDQAQSEQDLQVFWKIQYHGECCIHLESKSIRKIL